MSQELFIGIDLGTSGCRACAIDENEKLIAMSSKGMPAPEVDGDSITQDANIWWQATQSALTELLGKIDSKQVKAISIDGTSGTVLVTDDRGQPLSHGLMYNDASCTTQAAKIKSLAPEDCAAQGVTSGLAKLMYLQEKYPQAKHLLHQADWIAAQLCGNFQFSDENNALKTGYDPVNRCWPGWISELDIKQELLPLVIQPGEIAANITPRIAKQFDLPEDCKIVTGTTDSIAAFIATGASRTGEAVTSLGSTLVLKIISDKPVFAARFGIYSHRLGDNWLVGGASNSGGAILKKLFSQEQLDAMTEQLNPEQETGLRYYPMTQTGERFPDNDPDKKPELSPRPADDVIYFQGLLESIASIEKQAYKKLHELGTEYPVSVQTAGGGSQNKAWNRIRSKKLGIPVTTAKQTEACFGSALLAKQGYTHYKNA